MNLNLVLHNWKCFESVSLSIPTTSFAIVDGNGSGKTSILSAVYSLFENKPWPGTKISESIKKDSEYYGILTSYPKWSLSGQIGSNGRLKNNFQKPKTSPIFSEQKPWPYLFTYLPSDNDWFFKSSSQKLAILDSLLDQSYQDYAKYLRNLENAVKAKNRYLKYCRENEITGDVIMIKQLGDAILLASKSVWLVRSGFLKLLDSKLKDFESWIASNVKDWKVEYRISDSWGIKRPFDEVIGELEVVDYSKIWKKELISLGGVFLELREMNLRFHLIEKQFKIYYLVEKKDYWFCL
ncbi:hypothetical protein HC766_07760 [Candidatus Gracilibacteria bacterium]|nr:hypothetical protein [Candidatus Gracilibacteria bacterium]